MATRGEGDGAKVTAFKAQVVGLQSVWMFAFMRPKPPLVHFSHTFGQYFGFLRLAPKLQDKFIAFIGDKTMEDNPTPVVLPPKNAW